MASAVESIPAGVCLIKTEYLVTDHERCLSTQYISQKDLEKIEDTEGIESNDTGSKKIKVQNNKKLKGQNKDRRKGETPFWKNSKEFCPSLTEILKDDPDQTPSCPKGDKCKFEHDPRSYLDAKLPDLGPECYIYRTTGHCPWGISCRFGGEHLSRNGVNLLKETLGGCRTASRQSSSALDKDTVTKLWKKKYDFSRSSKVLRDTESRLKRILKDGTRNDPDVSLAGTDEGSHLRDDRGNDVSCFTETLGSIDDTDVIVLRQEEKKKLDWRGLLYLSPLTTVGNLPFRRICVEYGADITCSEMTLALSLLQGTREWSLVRRHPSEKIFGIQICGNNPGVMTKTAQVLEENASLDFVDINLGCPIDALYQQGCGSGMMARKGLLMRTCTSIASVLKDIPLTVKLRTGVASSTPLAQGLMPLFRSAGVQLATVHGRSREQRYTRNADWLYINECAGSAKPMPVFGNGDILSYEDYTRFLELAPNCSGAMIGRGALIKPWIFREIKEKKHLDISSDERFDIIKKYINYGLEHWGSDTRGVETTRRFLLEWLSFLHRYVPVGLLERPPQMINQRPPVYRGRNELETLMSSANCSDWVKISEMLLGPVPDGFVFLPKHKSNAWK